MDRHRTEFAVTMRTLKSYLPPPPCLVLDCGGGPGRYAIELSRQGYQVTLFDLSIEKLQLAQEKANKSGIILIAYDHGSATDLSRYPSNSFDAVLLMGPLYHLFEKKGRLRALTDGLHVLKPGGKIFVTFIGRYAAHRHAAVKYPTWLVEDAIISELLLESGKLPHREGGENELVAYFAHPSEVAPLCREAGFEVEKVLGVEGLLAAIDEKVNDLSDEAWDAWVEINCREADDPYILGSVEHLLVVATKPRWRTVLCRIAKCLNSEGVQYKVVGGTVLALHGVHVPVKDIDIETTAEDAYRFLEIFQDHILQRVALREGNTYRSHYGRFDIDGIEVEVMGDIHRLEGNQWLPTTASTHTTTDLDGVQVHSSWLEEETLAYFRRGRLERAAQCVIHCDRDRLLSLITGERYTNVL